MRNFLKTSLLFIAVGATFGCATKPVKPNPVVLGKAYILVHKPASVECKSASIAMQRSSGGNFSSQGLPGGGCRILRTQTGIELPPLSGITEIKIYPLVQDSCKVITLPISGPLFTKTLGGTWVSR